MLIKDFKKIIENIQKYSDKVSKLYELNVDLIDFNDEYYENQNILLKYIYTKEGLDWFDWFVYEKLLSNQPEEMTAHDADGTEILKSVDELWEFLEKDYRIKENTNGAI